MVLKAEMCGCYGDSEHDYEPTAKTKAVYARILMVDSALQEASRELSNASFDLHRLSLILPSYNAMGRTSESFSDLLDDYRDIIEEEWDEWVSEHLKDPEYFTDVTEVESE